MESNSKLDQIEKLISLLSNSIVDLNTSINSIISIRSSQNSTNLIKQQASNNNQIQSNCSTDNIPWITIPVHIPNIDSLLSKLNESSCQTFSQSIDIIMQQLPSSSSKLSVVAQYTDAAVQCSSIIPYKKPMSRSLSSSDNLLKTKEKSDKKVLKKTRKKCEQQQRKTRRLTILERRRRRRRRRQQQHQEKK